MKFGLKLAIIYLSLFAITGLYLACFAKGAMEGFYLVLFAMPWAPLIMLYLARINFNPANHIVTDILAVYLPVLLNVYIIYLLGNFIGMASKQDRKQNS